MVRWLVRAAVPAAALVVGFGATSLLGGCGSKGPPPGPATVRGKVTFNGRPVVGGLVVFTPDPQRGGRGQPARGETDAEGAFALRLDAGAPIPAGWYRVSIAPAPTIPDPAADGPLFPPDLARPDRSGLDREVVAGKEHVFEFAVESAVGSR